MTAHDNVIHNAQVIGRASGVCCERGWAAGWAAGRRAGAHDTCGRGRGDTGRRTESCPPRPTQPTAPAQRSVHVRPTLRRRDPAPTSRRGWRATRMAGPRWGRGTAQRQPSGAPLAALIKGNARRHATRMKNAPGSGTRQRRPLRADVGQLDSNF